MPDPVPHLFRKRAAVSTRSAACPIPTETSKPPNRQHPQPDLRRSLGLTAHTSRQPGEPNSQAAAGHYMTLLLPSISLQRSRYTPKFGKR